MMFESEKRPEDYIREGAKFVSGVVNPEGAERFTAELLYQRVLLGLESMLYGQLVNRGVQPFSHNAAGLAAEFQRLEVADELFCLNLVAFSKIQNMDSQRPSSETPFPLGVDEVRAQARRILEVLGPTCGII
ncbi:hypothetical protein [Holophaga foetida]|uniref:hypothetical protein n=1 Tax=Holophaga foetida TaxID=35839 RepID=UPI0002474A09|nr:hypothetical protein [Holophaga foetida]